MPFTLGQIGAFLLVLVVIFLVGRFWYALVEGAREALRRRFFRRKEKPWHPPPPEKDDEAP